MIVDHAPGGPVRDWGAQLTEGVLLRRLVAWWIDMVVVAALFGAAFASFVVMGVLTLGLTLPMLALLPAVPVLYHWLTLASPMAASPGQLAMGIAVRDWETLEPPGPLQALGFTLLLYLTLAAGGVWVLVALFTPQHRTLHDMFSGVVVVRRRALTLLHDDWNMGRSAPGHSL
jgi:uncharacterized RDD family membrane protein YckC